MFEAPLEVRPCPTCLLQALWKLTFGQEDEEDDEDVFEEVFVPIAESLVAEDDAAVVDIVDPMAIVPCNLWKTPSALGIGPNERQRCYEASDYRY